MTRNLVLLQLAFNVVILAALALLAWRTQWRRPSRPRRERLIETIAPPPLPREEPDLEVSLGPDDASRDERAPCELAAEADARARYLRFRERGVH